MAILCSTAVRCNSSLEKALADIATAGFRQVDLLAIEGWVHVNPSDLAERPDATLDQVTALFRRYGITPLVLNTGVGVQHYQRSAAANTRRARQVQGLICLAQRYDIQIAALQSGRPDPARPWGDTLSDSVASLREVVAAGQAAGVTFALEMHVGSLFETLDQGRRLFEALPDLQVAYDPSHFVMQGIDIRDTAWLLDHACHVHVRDAALGRMQVPYGEGLVDFDWLRSALRDRGYQGHVAIEYLETAEFDAMDSTLRLYEALGGDAL